MISNYSFGNIIINGSAYTKDIIVHRSEVRDWWRIEGHRVCIQDIEEILNDKPDSLIIGTGYYGAVEVEKSVIEKANDLSIELLVIDSRQACKKFNEKLSKGEDVSLAIHLTC